MKVLITGGAGFIGSNLAEYFLQNGHSVRIMDDLSRNGTESNLNHLLSLDRDLDFFHADVRDFDRCHIAVQDVDLVYHLAAQVAVTTSVTTPRHDFEVNLLGTVNILEAVRSLDVKPMVIFTSTNKVYGKMDQFDICERNNRWEYADLPDGNPETTPLDFYSPYGCSKGGADQYVLDYSRIYNIDTVVFRMSCIYGPGQMGCEDQGWVAYFLIQAELARGITIYGDGKQVRDVLYISDLIDAFVKAYEYRSITSGKAYNIGGGPRRTLSLLEFISMIQNQLKLPLPYNFSDWRPGDQKVYVSDIRRAAGDFKWMPRIEPEQGIHKLSQWIHLNKNLFKQM
ncbi:SDR family NAD(P)-dependent oxidoreductase [bacterium]|nr:SDR family NAD(P)-dependent oxidoreductase [candidate division CSSED10-310 bacterium]